MKKKWYLIAFTVVLLCGGCEKFITFNDPLSSTDENWWKTQAQATAALNTVYESVPWAVWGNTADFYKSIMQRDALSEDAVARQNGRGAYNQFVLNDHNANWNLATVTWREHYRGIRRACRFLDHIDRPYFTDNKVRERMKNEARALRAYYHMDLMMNFGGVPIVDKTISPADNQRTRNTPEEVYAFVISELEAVAPELPVSYDEDELWRMSRGTCWSLISRLALYMGDYSKAKEAAKKVIDLDHYELYGNYHDLFKYAGEINNERIFIRKDGAKYPWLRATAPASMNGQPCLFPSAAIINAYETAQGKRLSELSADSLLYYKKHPEHNRDPRFYASVIYPGGVFDGDVIDPFDMSTSNRNRIGIANATATGFYIQKYTDPRDRNVGVSQWTLDFMLFRYAEVLLNYVEALVELGEWQHPDVVTYMNQIRARAGMPPMDDARYAGKYISSQAGVRDFVRHERRIELAFEGNRYYDMKRWGIANEVMNGQVYGAYPPGSDEPYLVEFRIYDPGKSALWPIPMTEILANSNMDQNPGY